MSENIDKEQQVVVNLIKSIAEALSDSPESISVKALSSTIIELRVAKPDLGKIIGKNGNTAKAIRTIVKGVSAKLQIRTHLEIVE